MACSRTLANDAALVDWIMLPFVEPWGRGLSVSLRIELKLKEVNVNVNLGFGPAGWSAAGPDAAEGVGFEPTEACASRLFKSRAFVRSAIPPGPDGAGIPRPTG